MFRKIVALSLAGLFVVIFTSSVFRVSNSSEPPHATGRSYVCGQFSTVDQRVYHLEYEWTKVWICSDGSVDLLYELKIALESGPDINYVFIGQPNSDFTIGEAMDQYGHMLSTSDASNGTDYRVRVTLYQPLSAGQAIGFNLTTSVSHMIYEDLQNPDNVAMQFIPTWWPVAVLEIRVMIVLPLGVLLDSVIASPSWVGAFVEDGRSAIYWEKQNLLPDEQYPVQISFPKWGAISSGTIYIRADGNVDPPTAPIYRTGDYYTLIGNVTSSADGIIVEKSNVIIDGAGYTIQGSGGSYNGISLSDRSNVTVKNAKVTNFNIGIVISGLNATNNCILSNNFANNGVGLVLVESSTNNRVAGNVFTNDSLIVNYSPGNVVSDNLVNGKPLVYLEGASDLVIEDAGSVVLVNCHGITMENLNLSCADVGIELWKTNSTKILGNVLTANYPYGIVLAGASSNNNVLGNNIAKSWGGIALVDFSSNNSISGNNVACNVNGIMFGYSSNNKIYHNNFVNNTAHVFSLNSQNVWDNNYPSGGNYWSDYAGIDMKSGPDQDYSGNDGIGDTPYVIDSNNKDRYPLIQPFPKPVNLEVPYQSQDGANWCATTSLAMALRYYGVATHNWKIAEYLSQGRDEGTVFGSDMDGQPIWFSKKLSDYLDSNYPNYKIGYYRTVTAQIFHDIRGNVSLERPVLLAIRKSPGEVGHVIVIAGFNSSGFFFNDPSGAAKDMCDKVVWINPGPAWNGYSGFVEDDPLSSIICTSYLSGARYINTGTLLVLSGSPSPIAGSLELHSYPSGSFDETACSFYVDKPLPFPKVYLDLDKGLEWKSLFVPVGNPIVGKSDTIHCSVYFYNHANTAQTYTVLYTITGYDGITYYINIKTESLDATSKDEYKQTVTLGDILTKTQYYHIQLQLLDSKGDRIDTISIPDIYYFASGISIKFEESQHHLYLHVYDSEGRHVGLNYANNETEIEVHDSYYFDNSNGTITIILPTYNSSCRAVVDATFAQETMETYNLTITTISNGQIIDQNLTQATIQKGAQNEYNIEISPSGTIISVPEFPSFLVPLLLFMIVTILGVIVRRKNSLSIR